MAQELPKDLYVVSVKSDGVVVDVGCCSVPMAIGPEVRYSLVTLDQQDKRDLLEMEDRLRSRYPVFADTLLRIAGKV